MNIADVMVHPVRTCRMHDSLERAAQLMWEHDCGAIVIVDARGHGVGMITDRDICMGAYTQGGPLRDIPVSTAASHRLIGVGWDSTVEHAEAVMRTHRIHRVVVTDFGGEPVGILSTADIARLAERIGPAHVVETLAAVSRHARA